MERTVRTAAEAGWHLSRYNVSAPVPGTQNLAIVNLYKRSCGEYTPLELAFLSEEELEKLPEVHPFVERFARAGLIANFDERAAIEESLLNRPCRLGRRIELTISPTLACNFACPYCFQDHGGGKMSAQVQDDVVALASRMIEASGAASLSVVWFGGEPLMAPDVVESLSERFIALAREHGCGYAASIITNGYLLTQKAVDMLAKARVHQAHITIDGLGPTHDASRYLAGGRPTFDKIAANLREARIPFPVHVRHNVHGANHHEMKELEDFVARLAQESGNRLDYYPAAVFDSADVGGSSGEVALVDKERELDVALHPHACSEPIGEDHHCSVYDLESLGIDNEGRLFACCGVAVDKPDYSFGTAHDWDPARPLETAAHPEKLSMYVDRANARDDAECRECVWLPICGGGCPQVRLLGGRRCRPFKDTPEAYVLSRHALMKKRRQG